jgi:hypothetical protein
VLCADLVTQKVSCDEMAKNMLEFQDVVTRRLPVTAHLSIHMKETMKLQFFLPEFFPTFATSFSLFSNLMTYFDVETWERTSKPKLIN